MKEKKKTKQQRWQEKQESEGKCTKCNEPLFSKCYCKAHTEEMRERARNRYRKKNGLPLNAPLTKTGRKKIGEVER
ncbi:hypothetical protein KAR91_24505 [Candidatus Pacearchaeota archaeon]|nr:hypothetical protein [Candidatus Pacearchaeota archaeon]